MASVTSITDASKNNIETTANNIAAELNKLWQLYRSGDFVNDIPIDLLQPGHFYVVCEQLMAAINQRPDTVNKLNQEFFQELTMFFHNFNQRLLAETSGNDKIQPPEPTVIAKLAADDPRFQHADWSNIVYYDFIKQFYFIISRYLKLLIDNLDNLKPKLYDQIKMYTRNFIDAISPNNYLLLNPELIRATIESSGENLLIGLHHFLTDLIANQGHLNITMTDMSAFKLGKNLATTPGKIIFQNDLMQLIHYAPVTTEIYQQPILFIPPWINKYYILDLTAEKSLVKWLLEQGFAVFMISWMNPDHTSNLASKKFADYMLEGPIAALDVITKKLGFKSTHLVGYCIGGTLLGCALSYLQHHSDQRVASATYLTTLLDFSNPGELGIFIDEAQISALENIMREKGFLDGRFLDTAFNIIRPNDLIWPFFINNYLLGKTPKPFDLLYWNADSTHLPAEMYSFYLRNMYMGNKLRIPNAITIANVPINLQQVTTPLFFVGAEKDHITPWPSTYAGIKLHNSPATYILSGSGHIAGIINPPAKNKYYYRTNPKTPKKYQDWLDTSTEHPGSWWPYWLKWLLNQSSASAKMPAKQPGSAGLPAIEDAPGSYVMKRI